MSRWFTVPVTVTIEVKVPDNEGPKEALDMAQTLFHKRIADCNWGEGNPWSAAVRTMTPWGPTFGTPEEEEVDEGDTIECPDCGSDLNPSATECEYCGLEMEDEDGDE